MNIPPKKKRVHDGLVEDIRRQIQEGQLKPDDYLLPERELARKYRVSSRAVREGLTRLEAEGLIRRHQGRGTIVLRRETKPETAKLRNVAVIYQGRIRDTSTAEDFDNLQQALQREGYGTTLYVADYSPEKETQIVERLVAEGVPGLVLFSAHPSTRYGHLQAAMRAGMKIVVYDHDFPDLDCNFVGIDDQLAACEATEHLIRLGCRELLFIRSERDWTTHTLRQRGFEEAAANWGSGLPRRVLQLPAGVLMPQLGAFLREHLPPLLSATSRPLGILAYWDEVALLVMEVLREAGWSVPGDAAVVGFANDLSGALAEIPLTTMAIPREEIARLAALLLINQMREPSSPAQKIRLKARLIIRESCGTYSSQAKRVSTSVAVTS